MQRTTLGIFILLALAVVACGPSEEGKINSDIINNTATGAKNPEKKKLPAVTFKNPRYEFGAISQGEIVKHTFEFTNTGEAPLIISSIYGECGCTVVDTWEKDPIQPGESGSFEAVFNSDKKSGQQSIKVFLAGNTVPVKNTVVLAGFVVTPKTQQPQ